LTGVDRLTRRLKSIPIEERLIALATLASLLVATVSGPFPYHDSTNHLARYVLLERAWFGQPVAWTVTRAIPTPYIAVDLLGVGLVHCFGPLAALKVLAVLTLAVLPAGMYALLCVTSPAQRGWALVGTLLSYSWWYLEGSFNFCLGVGLLFFALALWWPCRSTTQAGRRTLVLTAAALLLCVHLFAALAFLVVVWLDTGLAGIMHRSARESWRSLTPRVVLALTVTASCAMVYTSMKVAAKGLPVVSPTLEPRSAFDKVLSLGSLFFPLTWPECAIMLAGYGYAVLVLFQQRDRGWIRDPFILSALGFLVLFLISPGTWNIDTRWLPMAYLLPFCVLGRPQPPSRTAMTVLCACCVLHAAVVAGYARTIRRQLHDVDTTLLQLPAEARLLPLVADHHRFRARPYVHYALWHTIRNSSPVGGLFSRSGTREGDPTYTHLSHFDLKAPLYYPASTWGVDTFDPLDCRRVHRDYDYVLLAGWNPRAGQLIDDCGQEVFRQGEVRLYQVK